MGHSYVEYDGNHILQRDGDSYFLMGALYHLHRQLVVESPSFHRLDGLMSWWLNKGSHPGPGCFNFGLDKYLSTDEECQLLSLLANKLLMMLEEAPEPLSVIFLNSIQLPDAPTYHTPVGKTHCFAVVQKFLSLIQP